MPILLTMEASLPEPRTGRNRIAWGVSPRTGTGSHAHGQSPRMGAAPAARRFATSTRR